MRARLGLRFRRAGLREAGLCLLRGFAVMECDCVMRRACMTWGVSRLREATGLHAAEL